MNTEDFEEAKNYLKKRGLWKESYSFRLDGWEVISIACMYKRKEKENADIPKNV